VPLESVPKLRKYLKHTSIEEIKEQIAREMDGKYVKLSKSLGFGENK